MKNIWILLLFVNFQLFSQSDASHFKKLSSPEKCWVIFHPFKAKRALNISHDAIRITDSIGRSQVLANDKNGGQVDAFKHGYWVAKLTLEIGERASIKLGKAHEKGNYRAFKKGKLEDGFLPDLPSSQMDLYNNNIGAQIALENFELTKEELIDQIIVEIKAGKLKILKKDDLGNFLTCDGVIISKEALMGIWKNDKCLVSSNTK